MLDVIREPTIALFVGLMGAGKSHEVLRLLGNEYKHHFDKIVLLCPTISINATYLKSKILWKDDDFYVLKPGENELLKYLDCLSKQMVGLNVLFIIDDCIADTGFDKNRGPLVDLAISIRHRGQTLFLLTQYYVAIPLKFRRLCSMTFVWFLKSRGDKKQIAEENDFINNWPEIFKKLEISPSKHTFAYIRGEKPFSVVIKDG